MKGGGAEGEEEVEEKRSKCEEKMQKVLKTQEALEKQKQDAALHTQKQEEEKLRQIIQNHEDKMKEDVQQKKTTCPEGSRNRRMQKTRGRSSPHGQTE